jgi:hypothetical protein
MLAIIQFTFVSQIDALIESNEAFIAKVNAGISQEELASCAAKCAQSRNLVSISEAQNDAFGTYKAGAYLGAFFILCSGIFGARHGYSARSREEAQAS